ncbi:hypothetical protein NQ318_007356 [Aromia moschata]|uniref:DDE Tnp4 domain-containing protein n=1 Tax=Aromia moschata TaxID=1265417 RepID=A0AAV8XPA3_9CUCU|nr:hypothetical protein NQ318_008499 [Aromia moschata]KAJ8940248.1 hypothetical protein NQ318_016705 [Aromia moschata]KAJ8941373.1 hypothetical protein NQ318_000839 [Aromia moschata]KAJ8948298.1 hypothetical protein NQ318_020785 [Aromia moschata]KAJ8951765.1 hypothetical protein NQ318_012616 [Aromia moschata]
MSSSSDEEIAAAYLLLKKRRKKTNRRFWVNPFYTINLGYSSYIVAQELNHDPVKFHGFYRMSKRTFQTLVEIIKPEISKRDTNYRKAVSAEERLLITLRYLATGDSYRALTYYFMRGLTTISNIIATTTEAIWTVLQPKYMSTPTPEKWTSIADRYYTLWNIPNCLGSLDGKHFRIKRLPKTGSTFYNYKGYFSIVLMACADADGLFTTIDVGEIGRNSDGAVFRTSNLGHALQLGLLELPQPRPLPLGNDDFPFYFVADEAFPLKNYIMRPYSKRTLDNRKRVFNYRLSRGRRSVECAFGMLVSKFRLFEGPICCKEETINSVIKAACVLHNFIRIKQGIFTQPTETIADRQDQVHIPIEPMPQPQIIRNHSEAQNIRERLCDYFLTPAGAIPYQWNHIV